MRIQLSILLPAYNNVCLPLVKELQRQAMAVDGLHFEVIVADDGSTDTSCLETNRGINLLHHCRLIECGVNRGRACIRNYLAQEATGEWLLFIDSDMVVRRNNYIDTYDNILKSDVTTPIVYGGYTICPAERRTIRYMLECRNPQNGDFRLRQNNAYNHFHTSNFLVRRDTMLRYPLDERFHFYGYEDVLWGKTLQSHGIGITHTDNPLSMETFEDNASFLRKSREAIRTLYAFRQDLRGYSSLLEAVDRLHAMHLTRVVAHSFALLEARMEKALQQERAPLWLFNLYRIGYLARQFAETRIYNQIQQ